MSSAENMIGSAATRVARSSGTPCSRSSSARRASGSASSGASRRVTDAYSAIAPGRKWRTVEAMSSWRGRLPSSQRDARSTSRRPSSSRSVWTAASHLQSSSSISPQSGRISKISRAHA